jgi:uncharacterized membrane protein YgaE (UPF0421/DUF939 family)
MKKINKSLFIGLLGSFLLFSMITETNYSFWLTLAVFFMTLVLITKEDESI